MMASAIDDLIDTTPDEPSAVVRWAERTIGPRAIRVAAVLAVSLALWADVVREGWVPAATLPGPIEVGQAFLTGIRDGAYLDALGSSVLALAIGFGLAVVAGAGVGGLQAAHETLDDALGGVVASLLALPGVVWLPLALIWFGPGARAAIFVVAVGSVGPIASRVAAGLHSVRDCDGRSHRGRIAFSALAAGVAAGWPYAWPSLVAAELIVYGAPLAGLLERETRPDAAAVVAAMVVVAVVGLAVNRFLIAPLERHAAGHAPAGRAL